jgi:cytochrome c peroxidase
LKRLHPLRKFLCTFIAVFGSCVLALGGDLTAQQELGKRLFFDARLSTPAGQSCASCHAPETGFSGPVSEINQETAVYPGAVPGRFGNRKPPSAAYAAFSPAFSYNQADETYQGGQFWDGRAATLVDQAKGPFLNPLEMNNPDAASVVQKVLNSDYRHLFEKVYGHGALQAETDLFFDMIAQSIAAYEASAEVNSFSSKYDDYLAGKTQLTPTEKRGLDLFVGKAGCAACHPSDPGGDGSPPLFTDFTYDNVGAPSNPRNPFYRMGTNYNSVGVAYRDLGLGGVLDKAEEWGKVKVPTLRNVAKRPAPEFVKSYLHNGSLKSLKEVVHFYNTRDRIPSSFADPDVIENVNREELGDLGLTDAEEDDIVAFLETLSDQLTPRPPVGSPGANPGDPIAGPGGPFQPGNPFRAARQMERILQFRPHSDTASRENSRLLR